MQTRIAFTVLVAGLIAVATAPPAAAQDGSSQPAPAAPGTAAPAPPKPAQAKPEATGFDRLSPDWPKWLKLGLLYRGRVEEVRPLTGSSGEYDGYYLNRLRLSAGAAFGGWMQVYAQIQDVESMGYAVSPAPKSMAGGFDLRQGYVEIGRRGKRGVLFTAGRAELSLGEGRLIASPDWGNSSRTYDLGRITAFVPGLKVDVFRAAPVDINPSAFDRAKPGEHFWGGYATLDKLKGLTAVDFYVLAKMNSVVTSELGTQGDGRVYTYGGRLSATVAKTWTFDTELALQRGHRASDDLSAWGGRFSVARPIGRSSLKPRAAVEYDYASGDENPKDGTLGTFDQLYASNHAKYGLADLIGWRNMHVAQARFELSPTKKLKLNTALVRTRSTASLPARGPAPSGTRPAAS
jgi:hypothetical protein